MKDRSPLATACHDCGRAGGRRCRECSVARSGTCPSPPARTPTSSVEALSRTSLQMVHVRVFGWLPSDPGTSSIRSSLCVWSIGFALRWGRNLLRRLGPRQSLYRRVPTGGGGCVLREIAALAVPDGREHVGLSAESGLRYLSRREDLVPERTFWAGPLQAEAKVVLSQLRLERNAGGKSAHARLA